MKYRWAVCDVVQTKTNGNRIWATTYTIPGAMMMMLKIHLGRYRGSQPHCWRRSNFYTPPRWGDLQVERLK